MFFKKEKKETQNKMDVSQESAENSAKAVNDARWYNSLIDQAVAEYMESGNFDVEKWKGKPVEVPEGDPLDSVLKNANILPPWLQLRKEIIKDMKALIDWIDAEKNDFIEEKIEKINTKIRKYNRQVPSYLLQKGLISSENIREKYESWL
mgnify:CR=1 FL=1